MAVLSDAQREAGWTIAKLGDIVTCLDHLRQPIKGLDRVPGPYPYYGASGVVDYIDQYAIDGKYLLISEDGENLRSRSLPIAFYAVGKSWVNNHAHIISASDSVMAYVKYVLNSHDVSAYLTGTTMPKLSQKSMMLIDIPLPPQDILERIAGILGSLDDKIEANTRLIQTIKEYMTALYKAEAKNGKVLELTDIADFVNGRAFTKDATGTGRVVIRIAELNNGLGASTVYNDIEVKEENTAYPGDVLMSWSGSLDTYVWHLPEAIINQHIFKVIPKDNYPKWLVYHACKSVIEDFQAIAVDKATTMGHIRRGDLKRDITIPAQEIPQMENLWNLWMNLEQENLQLAATRDALIKRLIG